jgi:hypothetical protein
MQDEQRSDKVEGSDILNELANQPAPSPTPVEPVAEKRIENPQLGPVVTNGRRSRKVLWLTLFLIVLVGANAFFWWRYVYNKTQPTAKPTTQSQTTKPTTKTEGLVLDTTKNYGNKYANGILPVGDGKYSTTAAKAGTVYTCAQYAQNFSSTQGGAGSRGPWFTNNNTEYDLSKKLHVQGSVTWQAAFTNTVSGSTRTIATNDLPSHTTGTFPIAATDPAYAYDRNPNTIKSQTLSYGLNASPLYGSPNCMGGEAGVMLTGVALFNAFDAGGRDAGAWEIQDSCSGHPQKSGEYHYHTLSSCIKDISVHTVIGYGLDGFPITGPTVATNSILTTNDLDECHGLTSSYTLDGNTITGYHYVMTQDFPYSVSCFRSTAIKPPGMQG